MVKERDRTPMGMYMKDSSRMTKRMDKVLSLKLQKTNGSMELGSVENYSLHPIMRQCRGVLVDQIMISSSRIIAEVKGLHL